jgi:hypothetical protein
MYYSSNQYDHDILFCLGTADDLTAPLYGGLSLCRRCSYLNRETGGESRRSRRFAARLLLK